MKRKILGFLLLLLAVSAHAQKQRFFNLTVEDVTIDSLLPHFTYAIPIGENYADSIYQLEIRYPEFLDMNAADVARYNALSGAPLPTLPEIQQQMVVERKKGILEFSLVPIVERNGKKQFLVSFMIALTSKPRDARQVRARHAASAENTQLYAAHSVLSSGRWAKIRVPANGIYNLTADVVRRAGFSDLSKVRIYGYGGHLQNEKISSAYLKEFDDLKEVPSCLIAGKRLFYGRGPVSWESNTALVRTRNHYSDYGYYFITESTEAPLTIDADAFLASVYPMADDYHSLHEIENYSWFPGGRRFFENTPIPVGKSHTYTLANVAKATNGTLAVGVSAGKGRTTVQIEVNGEKKEELRMSTGEFDFGAEVERKYALTGLRDVDSIKITTLSGGPARLDYVSMTYDTPRFAPNLAEGTFPIPEYVHNITNQDLHSHTPVDLVIIIPTSQKLLKQAQRLATFHEQHDGMKVRIVPADEIFNEFSSGTPDAMAYRRYMKMLYDRATTEAEIPKSLLLFGDCVWDNRMVTPECRNFNVNDYLLAYESNNSFSLTDCYINDGWYTLMDEGEGVNPTNIDKEDIGVGRFPVTTVNDAQTIVDKTINYASNKNAGDWQNVIMFMGDDGNNNLHMKDVNETADTIMTAYPNYLVKKVMWDAYTRIGTSTGFTYPEVSSVIKQQQAQGALIMDYAGHGSEIQISHETVLRITDFQNFTNANLPLWITASCDIMPFDGTIATIGEEAMLNKKGGSVAFWGTTRTVYASYNKRINTAFMKHVMSFKDGKPISLGEAQRLAKIDMIDTKDDTTYNKLQYSLLGDPALSLNLPTLGVVIDSINGIALNNENQITLKGGSIATVKGHIEKASEKVKNFNGLMSATVRDTRELITCKGQEETSEKPFTYYDRQKVLYNGSDSVRNGEFSFTFAVPRDLNYANGTGLINVYAVSNDHTLLANGAEDRFNINGSEQVSNDSIGPSIYCYLNTPAFVNGGKVNCTPYFIAQITDANGINAAGNGVGHDMQLIIDGDMMRTYNLNDNFRFDFGSYTKGSTYFSIPELSEGRHQLKFRVWDILNNPSTATLDFTVDKGMAPDIEDVSCTNNPAKTETTFIVTHNYVGSNVDIELEVLDMSGRLLWRHNESGVSTGNAYTVNWDLTMNSGARLQTGVYLYRVHLSSGGAVKESKAKKLIIINNK
ncbi:type IX secretion system sortase PorU [Prevotella intermedia]|uniref:type IX secretion system sortase PorU n=1 Tax=Prevotella intermedia TaxID=28131 RepID=UPI000DC1F393|nr:type IX secretion system sortase PorU [Prevotella intermedia]AWX06839.1 Por secretion system protein [Prevotella intermedia]